MASSVTVSSCWEGYVAPYISHHHVPDAHIYQSNWACTIPCVSRQPRKGTSTVFVGNADAQGCMNSTRLTRDAWHPPESFNQQPSLSHPGPHQRRTQQTKSCETHHN
jgi:hypothetical protein